MKRFYFYLWLTVLTSWLIGSACCPPWGDCDPECRVSPAALNFGAVEVGSSKDLTFEIKNVGSGTLEGTVGGGCGVYAIVSGDGQYSLGADQAVTVRVRFSPATGGSKTCKVSTGAGLCSDVTCTGAGAMAPECLLTPSSLDFDSVQAGSCGELTFEIENIGGGTLSGNVVEGCDNFSVESGGGAFDLGEGETRTITVRYSPVATAAETCLVMTGIDSCTAVNCSGVGTPGPECSVTPDTLIFSSVQVGLYEDLIFEVENTGGGVLTGNVSVTSDNFSIESGGGAFGVSAGQARTVTIRFAPTTAVVETCAVDIGTGVCIPVVCIGAGYTGPECQIVPGGIAFGPVEVGSYADETFQIKNVGGGTLTGDVNEDSDDFWIVSGGGVFNLEAGQTQMVTVRFAPTSDETKTCTIETGTGLCAGVSCTGDGTPAPACQLTPESLNFGSVLMRKYKDLTFEIENVGGGTLVGNVTENFGHYQIISGGGVFSLTSGQTLTVTIRFAPERTGLLSCWVSTGNSDCGLFVCQGVGLRWDAVSGGE